MNKALNLDKEVIERCKQGDKSAFRELFHEYKSYAYNLIYKLSGPSANNEDLIQDVFFQVYLSIKRFRGDSSFKTWFHRIVIHVCTRFWRYQNTEKRISSRDTVNYDLVDYTIPGREMDHAREYELKSTVDDALQNLDMKYRIPMVLHFYSGMDFSEISRILEIPEGTVKSRMFTARNTVRDYLKKGDIKDSG